MFSTFSRAWEPSRSVWSGRADFEQWRSARATKPNGQNSMSAGQTSPAFPMWKRYEQIKSRSDQLTWLPEASHVRTCLTLDDAPGLRASAADYGLTSPVSFANYDPVTSSWRTCQACLVEEWERFSETWPQAGTTRNGTASRLRPLAPRTYERESGFLPTPVASETKRTTPYSQGGQSLSYVLGGRPSQALLEWMMGFPAGLLTRPAQASSPKSPSSSATQS